MSLICEIYILFESAAQSDSNDIKIKPLSCKWTEIRLPEWKIEIILVKRNFLDQIFKNKIISYFDAPEEVKSIGTKINGIK